MKVTTENNFVGLDDESIYKNYFQKLNYSDGTYSSIPHGFFRDWLDNDISSSEIGRFYIGRGSGFGVGSIVKYDGNFQSLQVGRYVAAGLRVKILLNGQHPMNTISTCLFSVFGNGLKNAPMPQYGDTVIKNDVWIGDEALILGGSCIENGCVIGARSVLPPNFKSEPYGIYVGSPAKLIRYRFSEKVRSLLLELAWWDMPIDWIKKYNEYFMIDLNAIEEEKAMDLLKYLISNR